MDSAVGVATKRWTAPLAGVCGLVLLAATVEIVLDAALEHSPLIPHQPHIATWLRSLGGERLGYRVFLIALLAFSVAYVVLLVLARARSHSDRTAARWAIGLVAVLNLIVFAGPILISTDVFSYIAYARMGVVHGIDPYTHGPVAIVGDPVFRYVGHDWLQVATAYGPLYTLITYPLGLLGVIGALWGMKLYALVASATTLALTWRVARRRGHDRVFALLAVGANPLYVIYGLGGAHNDLIMLALMMAAVAFTLSRPGEAVAGATVVAGALVKAARSAVLLPFMVLSRRRPAAVYGGARGARALRARRVCRVRHPRHRCRLGAEPRLGVRLDRQLPQRAGAPVRQAGGVPGRPRSAQGRARADPRCTCVAHLARL